MVPVNQLGLMSEAAHSNNYDGLYGRREFAEVVAGRIALANRCPRRPECPPFDSVPDG
jgi:hypothetical protein